MRTWVRPVLVLALGRVRGIPCQGRVSQAHPRDTPRLVAATRAHTAPPRGPARAATAGGVLTPRLACGLTVCPTSPLSSTGHGAAPPSSSHDLRRVIQGLRCSVGQCSAPSWPCSPPTLPAWPATPWPAQEVLRGPSARSAAGRGGGPFSLLLEAVQGPKSGHADHPRPHKSSRQMVPISAASQRHQREVGHTGRVTQSPNVTTSAITEWPWCMAPVVYPRSPRACTGLRNSIL